jgi:hypothetical protein
MRNSAALLIVIFLLLPFVLFTSCTNEAVPAKVAFILDEKDLIPEGITWDPETGQFFVSSIMKEKIVSVSDEGLASDFITSGRDSIMETLGMKVDESARRLWVVSNKKIGEVSYSAVHVFNIDTRELLKKIIIGSETPQLFNDLALSHKGDAYITDSYNSRIYRVGSDLYGIEPFAGPDSLLLFVNGIAVSPDDKLLYAASGARIAIIDIETGAIMPIADPTGAGSKGIDGIVWYKGSLLGVINAGDTESEMYVARYILSHDMKEIEEKIILDKGNPLFNLPTTCVIAGDELYILGSTSLRLFFQDKKNEKNLFMNPLILKYKLDN